MKLAPIVLRNELLLAAIRLCGCPRDVEGALRTPDARAPHALTSTGAASRNDVVEVPLMDFRSSVALPEHMLGGDASKNFQYNVCRNGLNDQHLSFSCSFGDFTSDSS